MLAGDEDLLDLDLLQQLGAQLQLDRIAQLRHVSAEDEEIRGRIHCLQFLNRARRFFDEALVDVLRIQMRIGNPGKFEALPLWANAMSMVFSSGKNSP